MQRRTTRPSKAGNPPRSGASCSDPERDEITRLDIRRPKYLTNGPTPTSGDSPRLRPNAEPTQRIAHHNLPLWAGLALLTGFLFVWATWLVYQRATALSPTTTRAPAPHSKVALEACRTRPEVRMSIDSADPTLIIQAEREGTNVPPTLTWREKVTGVHQPQRTPPKISETMEW